ncbi:hypothetical protein BGS_1296 [Beggiatoa sp. SS]|nr:hypothetical protein BGS_1296 [Beggiatoa sp. SS]
MGERGPLRGQMGPPFFLEMDFRAWCSAPRPSLACLN